MLAETDWVYSRNLRSRMTNNSVEETLCAYQNRLPFLQDCLPSARLRNQRQAISSFKSDDPGAGRE